MELTFLQVALLAIVQGAAELLPVSSSAHVILAERLMGIDPTTPEMTFLLVMLHTGTMFAVLMYFWRRWIRLSLDFFKWVIAATAVTGFVGLGLKFGIEHLIDAELESLFGNLKLIACALFTVGIFIIVADFVSTARRLKKSDVELTLGRALWIGLVQALCLPIRGFSRSGATISAGLILGISRQKAEDFSFALAVAVTPPVILHQLKRLIEHHDSNWMHHVTPGLLGMVLSFGSGLLALRWLSNWLEQGRWKFFGFYCLLFATLVWIVG